MTHTLQKTLRAFDLLRLRISGVYTGTSYKDSVTLSSVTLNFELRKVVLSSCLARLLLVSVHFIKSEH